MPLFCEYCGEEEHFIKRFIEERSYDVTAECDNEGSTEEIIDSEIVDEYGSRTERNTSYFCKACDEEVDEYDEDDIMQLKILHTDKQGHWHRDELPPNRRNVELQKEFYEMKL